MIENIKFKIGLYSFVKSTPCFICNLLLRKSDVFAVKADVNIGYSVVILIEDELIVEWF
ncbi:MAG: hypothetical protein LBL13_02255 [Bacteroidales bacterium]|nr:hypothetical protein [Bacteroidales bacterium]